MRFLADMGVSLTTSDVFLWNRSEFCYGFLVQSRDAAFRNAGRGGHLIVRRKGTVFGVS